MSYSFGLFVKQVDTKEKAFTFAFSVTEEYYNHIDDAIRNEILYCPSMKNVVSEENRRYLHQADRFWTQAATMLNFTYWEDKKLLALTGYSYPKAVEGMFAKNIIFQNSTDQDYELETWSSVCPWMEQVKERWASYSAEEVFDKYRDGYDDEDWDVNDAGNVEFFRKTMLYSEIFDELDLDSWLCGNQSKEYIRFSLSPLTTEKRRLNAEIVLRDLLRKGELQ